jgi:hypothetical protein
MPTVFKSNVMQFARTEGQDWVNAKVFDSALTATERAAKKQLDASIKAEPNPARRSRRPPVAEFTEQEQEQARAFFT